MYIRLAFSRDNHGPNETNTFIHEKEGKSDSREVQFSKLIDAI